MIADYNLFDFEAGKQSCSVHTYMLTFSLTWQFFVMDDTMNSYIIYVVFTFHIISGNPRYVYTF